MNRKPAEKYMVDVLGCKVNQYDAQQIGQLLERYGLHQTNETGDADVIVVHTCGVTATATQKSRQCIRRLQRDNPLAHVIVTGCAANEKLTRVDQNPVFRVPAGPDWLQRLAEQMDALVKPDSGIADEIETDTFTISSFGDQTRAFLKVQDGCDIGCSFCIVPQLRKGPRDKSIGVAVREATALAHQGYREIVVTGVSVGLYGRDTGDSLAALLYKLAEVPDIERIRLSSLHPGELTDELLDVWASSPKIMPHLHLSLQSGSTAMLQAMRRGYTAEEYYDAVERARTTLADPAFTTDVIVGFPGETDVLFEEGIDFCKKVGFSRMHVFTYSPRPNTPAARMGGQINGRIAAERSERLRALGREMARKYHRRFIGQEVEVLIEDICSGVAHGYSEHYIPVEFQTGLNHRNTVATVMVSEASASGISGANRL